MLHKDILQRWLLNWVFNMNIIQATYKCALLGEGRPSSVENQEWWLTGMYVGACICSGLRFGHVSKPWLQNIIHCCILVKGKWTRVFCWVHDRKEVFSWDKCDILLPYFRDVRRARLSLHHFEGIWGMNHLISTECADCARVSWQRVTLLLRYQVYTNNYVFCLYKTRLVHVSGCMLARTVAIVTVHCHCLQL